MYRLASLLILVGCAQNEYAKAWYDDVEAGSEWQLAISAGKLDPYSVLDGTCPLLATKHARLPDGTTTGCEPGCTCALSAALYDDGDAGSSWTANLSFDQTCTDHASLSCFDVHPEDGDPILCRWTKDLVTCRYTLTPQRIR